MLVIFVVKTVSLSNVLLFLLLRKSHSRIIDHGRLWENLQVQIFWWEGFLRKREWEIWEFLPGCHIKRVEPHPLEVLCVLSQESSQEMILKRDSQILAFDPHLLQESPLSCVCSSVSLGIFSRGLETVEGVKEIEMANQRSSATPKCQMVLLNLPSQKTTVEETEESAKESDDSAMDVNLQSEPCDCCAHETRQGLPMHPVQRINIAVLDASSTSLDNHQVLTNYMLVAKKSGSFGVVEMPARRGHTVFSQEFRSWTRGLFP